MSLGFRVTRVYWGLGLGFRALGLQGLGLSEVFKQAGPEGGQLPT